MRVASAKQTGPPAFPSEFALGHQSRVLEVADRLSQVFGGAMLLAGVIF